MTAPQRICLLALTGMGLIASGCARQEASQAGAATEATAAHDHADHDGNAHGGHTHGGWWCDEHGVPENVCGLCDTKLAASFQKKGDWCQEHDRPDSQCFVCHPEFEARFAAQYEAKYGKKPPKPEG